MGLTITAFFFLIPPDFLHSLFLSLGHISVQREKQETESPFLAYLAMLSQLSLP